MTYLNEQSLLFQYYVLCLNYNRNIGDIVKFIIKLGLLNLVVHVKFTILNLLLTINIYISAKLINYFLSCRH